MRETVLLTGFGPFPGVAHNASADLVRALVSRVRRDLPNYRFASAVLPTEWTRAPRLIAALHARYAPRLVLHFGVAASTEGFRIETQARNVCRGIPDAAACFPASTRLDHNGADIRPVTIATLSIAAALRKKGYPVSLSDDAGDYLCNAALYASLALAERRGGRCQVGFLHVPVDLSRPPLSLSDATAGAVEIVKTALEFAPPPLPLTST